MLANRAELTRTETRTETTPRPSGHPHTQGHRTHPRDRVPRRGARVTAAPDPHDPHDWQTHPGNRLRDHQPTIADAGPEQIAAWLRGHWTIENWLHWVRDVDYDEDRSQIHTRSGPQAMATLRNTAIGILRLAGHTNIAAALRHHTRDFNRPVELLLSC